MEIIRKPVIIETRQIVESYVASDGYVLKYQILSNDENTLYFEYDTSSLNAGTYKITQKCSVE
mgnify:CR=1 FL=1